MTKSCQLTSPIENSGIKKLKEKAFQPTNQPTDRLGNEAGFDQIERGWFACQSKKRSCFYISQ